MQYKNDNTTFYRSSVVSVAHGLKFDATGILNCEKLNNFACLKVWGAVCNNIISDRFSTKTASLAEIAISTTDNISACRDSYLCQK